MNDDEGRRSRRCPPSACSVAGLHLGVRGSAPGRSRDELLAASRRPRRRPRSRRAGPRGRAAPAPSGCRRRRTSRRRATSTSPYWAMPDELELAASARASTMRTVSPTAKSSSSAVPASITTSSAPVGPAALVERERVEAPVARVEAEAEGRRAVRLDRPRRRAPTIFVGRSSSDARRPRSRRRRRARTRSSTSSGMGGVCALVPWKLMSDSAPLTTASVPAYDSTKIVSNARSIVSVSTYVPLTIATPRTIAIAVSSERSLRPARPLSATLRHRCSPPRPPRARSGSCSTRSGRAPSRSRRRRGRARGRRSTRRASRA